MASASSTGVEADIASRVTSDCSSAMPGMQNRSAGIGLAEIAVAGKAEERDPGLQSKPGDLVLQGRADFAPANDFQVDIQFPGRFGHSVDQDIDVLFLGETNSAWGSGGAPAPPRA